MKQLIERLREICLAGWWDDEDVAAVVDSLPQLLDRLEALEWVVEVAREVAEYAPLEYQCSCAEEFDLRRLADALAALDAKGSE